MVGSQRFLRRGETSDLYRLAEILLPDRHDLIHKAVGWSLREAGKRVDADELRRFLDQYASTMPRTALRYAIEHFDAAERHYLSLPVRRPQPVARARTVVLDPRRRVPGDITVERSGAVEMTVLGGKSRQDAFLFRYDPGADVVELFVELDGGLGGTILEASQAARIDPQQLGDKRHVTGGVADRPPDSHPRCVSEQVVDQRSPLQPPLPGHRRRVDAIADRFAIVHQRVPGSFFVLSISAAALNQ